MFFAGGRAPRMRLFCDFHLAPRSRIGGANSPFPYMTSWPAQCKFLYILLLLSLLCFGGTTFSGQNFSFALCAAAEIWYVEIFSKEIRNQIIYVAGISLNTFRVSCGFHVIST